MGGRNKKQRAGSAAHTASAATAAARARAAAEAGAAAAAAEAGSRAAPRPPPASKEPRVKQGTGPCDLRRPRPGRPGSGHTVGRRGAGSRRLRGAPALRAGSAGSPRGRGLHQPWGLGVTGEGLPQGLALLSVGRSTEGFL